MQLVEESELFEEQFQVIFHSSDSGNAEVFHEYLRYIWG